MKKWIKNKILSITHKAPHKRITATDLAKDAARMDGILNTTAKELRKKT